VDILLFTREGCSYCARAKGMLHEQGMAFEEVRLGDTVTLRGIRAATGGDTVPQVFVDGTYIGDSEALEAWLQAQRSQAA
jgi:glutaredoxin-like protein